MNAHSIPQNDDQQRFAMNLSFWIGIGMLGIKTAAYAITSSAAILSDAAESIVHVIAVGFAWYSLRLAARPADRNHRYGYSKISFVSAGFEGGMIFIAALFIIYESISGWISGIRLQNLDYGLLLTLAALLVNGALGGYLLWVGKRNDSLILEANGKHVLADAWTSLGVLVGVALTWLTGWLPLDPLCAIAVAIHILFSGFALMKRSLMGLLDAADPEVTRNIEATLKACAEEFGISYHNIKHLDTGAGHRIEMHLLFDDRLTIQQAHSIATVIEDRLYVAIPRTVEISTRLEPKRAHERQHARHP